MGSFVFEIRVMEPPSNGEDISNNNCNFLKGGITMKKMMAMVATMVMAITMVGCGQAIPATTVSTQKLEVAPVTENVIVENIETENIETETIEIEEEETKRELMIILRFRNETGTILFHMACFDDDSFFCERTLDDMVEALNNECDDTYLKVEENGHMVIKRIDEKKNIENVSMADVTGNEDELK